MEKSEYWNVRKFSGQGRPCPYLCNVKPGYRCPPFNFRKFLSNLTKLGQDVKGVRKIIRIAFRTSSRMSGRRESRKRPEYIFAYFTVFLTLRYHHEYYGTSVNHYFDLGIGKLGENKDRKRLVRFFLKRQLVVTNWYVKYYFISNCS